MSSIAAIPKIVVSSVVRCLNQPVVKEGVKQAAGAVTFAFGVVELYDMYQIFIKGRQISSEPKYSDPTWIETAHKAAIVCGKISLILSAGVSRPGAFIISKLVGSVVSTTSLERIFGPNTIFAINPRHPRHVISIAAVVFALPVVVTPICSKIAKVYRKAPVPQMPILISLRKQAWFSDTKVRLMALVNTLTSRPVFHIGNQFGRFILRRL